MRKVFIADAHLKRPEDHNYRKLLAFLKELPPDTDTLFILGDLFEFWIGYPTVPFPHYLPVLEELYRLRQQGVDIVYFEGNHDFHMGPFFTETLGATVYPGPAIIELDGKQMYLCHGDEINSKDYSYRLLRFVFHSRFTKALTWVVPAKVTSAIADYLGRKSQSKHGERRSRWDFVDILRRFAAERFAAGCDVVVTGHFHTPLLEDDGNRGRVVVSLGDWITHYSYGEWDNGVFSLKTYD